MSKLLGITGTIGSGKSTVGSMLQSKGIPVIDTDAIVHDLLANSQSTKTRVAEHFGTIERSELAAKIFNDKQAKKDLEAILHPEVIVACRKAASDLGSAPVIAFLVPLLFEANLQNEYDQIWSVQVEEKELRSRLKSRNNFTDGEIDARLANQLPQAVKSSKAHYTIDNSGSLEKTREQVEKFLRNLLND